MNENICGKCGKEYKLEDGAYRVTELIVCPDCHPSFEAEYQGALSILKQRASVGIEQADENYWELINAINRRQYVNPNDYL